MNKSILLLIYCFGCSSLPGNLNNKWHISKEETLCFSERQAFKVWNSCLDKLGSERFDCQAKTLILYNGTYLGKDVKVNIYYHGLDSISKIMINNQVMFCPSTSILHD